VSALRLDALCDVFLHDNQRPGATALLDRGIIVAALETSGGTAHAVLFCC
jgi:hypothetical protein